MLKHHRRVGVFVVCVRERETEEEREGVVSRAYLGSSRGVGTREIARARRYMSIHRELLIDLNRMMVVVTIEQ